MTPTPTLLAAPLRSTLDTASEMFEKNRTDVLEQLDVIDALLDEAEAGGGPARMDRLRAAGKLPVRERIAHVLDPDSPFLEISPLAAYDSDYAMGGGMIVGIGVIAGTECVILANDPSVLGGALTPYALKKWNRALEIARDNHLPYVSFVESAGADLRVDTGGGRRVQVEHFAESGRFFYDLIQLSQLEIPTVCVVFGSSTAGGAYQPGLSRLHHRGEGAVEGLPRRPAPREDGHRRGQRRRDPRWGRPARGGVGARRLLRHRRDGRHPHLP